MHKLVVSKRVSNSLQRATGALIAVVRTTLYLYAGAMWVTYRGGFFFLSLFDSQMFRVSA